VGQGCRYHEIDFPDLESIMNDRTPEQVNSSLDRTEQILSDLTIRLDRLESLTEALLPRVQDLFDASDRTNAAIDRIADQMTRTNESVDRLSGVFQRYMEQSIVEARYQRDRITELTTRVNT
jgi:ABC-type transporter Mla subunit MlaD